jgi:regulator of protease activity HflC (stomatin/prohibitin superfamily)
MGYLVVSCVIFVVAIVLSVFRHGYKRELGVLAVALFVAWTGWNSFYQVPAGSVGLIYSFGAIVGQTGEGLQLVPPWRTVYAASTQVQSRFYKTLDSFSSETQNVYVQATINYHVSPDNIQKLYRTVGPNYASVLIDPRVHQDFKDETVKFKSVEIAPNRDVIRKEVRKRITGELEGQSIVVDDVLLNNVSFSKEFESSIENKQIQSQNALAEQQKVIVARQRAEQAVATARGRAQSTLIEAEAQARANKELAASITPDLVQYQMVSKLAPNVQTIMLPAGQPFILNGSQLKAATPR